MPPPRVKEPLLPEAVEIDENLAEAHVALGLVHFRLDWRWQAAELGYADGVTGQAAAAQRTIDELKPLCARGDASAILLAYPHIGLGEIDLAFAWLERAAEERAGLLAYLKVEPMFDRLRADARFPPLIRRLGLAS